MEFEVRLTLQGSGEAVSAYEAVHSAMSRAGFNRIIYVAGTRLQQSGGIYHFNSLLRSISDLEQMVREVLQTAGSAVSVEILQLAGTRAFTIDLGTKGQITRPSVVETVLIAVVKAIMPA